MATVANKASPAPLDKSHDSYRFTITPSDTLFLEVPIDAVFAAVAGNISVGVGDRTPKVIPIPAGGPTFLGQVNRVYATNTTATGLTGLASKALR